MPETQDWAAAPQTGIEIVGVSVTATEDGAESLLIDAQADRKIVIVGMDLTPNLGTFSYNELRDMVTVDMFDSANLGTLMALAISPESPFASGRPPFGSMQAAVGSAVKVRARSAGGSGSQSITIRAYYFALKA